MDKKLIRNLLIATGIGLVVGVVNILIAFSVGFSDKPFPEWVANLLAYTIDLPILLSSEIVGSFGCVTFGCWQYIIIISLVFYALLGTLIYYIYHRTKKRKK